MQQGGGRGGQVTGLAAGPGLRQGVLGGRGVEQVEHLGGIKAERAAGDNDQVGDLKRDHGWSSWSRLSAC